jgi:hypothetical protein
MSGNVRFEDETVEDAGESVGVRKTSQYLATGPSAPLGSPPRVRHELEQSCYMFYVSRCIWMFRCCCGLFLLCKSWHALHAQVPDPDPRASPTKFIEYRNLPIAGGSSSARILSLASRQLMQLDLEIM